MDTTISSLSPRQAFSRLALVFALLEVLAVIFQLLWAVLFARLSRDLLLSATGLQLLSILPIYAGAGPLCWLLLRRMPRAAIPPRRLHAGDFCLFALLCLGAMMLGGVIGNLFGTAVDSFFPGSSNPVPDIVGDISSPLNILLLCVVAPAGEELLFRRMFLSRLLPYGERTAVLLCALFFALFHGNFYQCFYAAFVGVILGVVYLRTGRIGYTVALHGLLNLLGGVLTSLFLSSGNLWLGSAYSSIYIALCLGGAVLLFTERRRLLRLAPPAAGAGLRDALASPGMIAVYIVYTAVFVLNIIA